MNIGSHATPFSFTTDIPSTTPELYLACLGGTNSKQIYLIVMLPGADTLRCITYATRYGNEYVLRNGLFSIPMDLEEKRPGDFITICEDKAEILYPTKEGTTEELYVACAYVYNEMTVLADYPPGVMYENEHMGMFAPRLFVVDKEFRGVYERTEPSEKARELNDFEVYEEFLAYKEATTDASAYRVGVGHCATVVGENEDGSMVALLGTEQHYSWYAWIPKELASKNLWNSVPEY